MHISLIQNPGPPCTFPVSLPLDNNFLACQTHVLETLSNPIFDSLKNGYDRELANNLFFAVTGKDVLDMDCKNIHGIYLQLMFFVHPDKNNMEYRGISHLATVNLNNAIDALRC